MSRASIQMSKQILPEVKLCMCMCMRVCMCVMHDLYLQTFEKMDEIIINCNNLPKEVFLKHNDFIMDYPIIQLKIMARTLVSNEQGGPLAALQVSGSQPGHHQTLSAIVIHTVACLLTRGNIDLFCPLTTLLTKPGDMAVRGPAKAHLLHFRFCISAASLPPYNGRGHVARSQTHHQ